MHIATLIKTLRPPFLLLSPLCCLIGIGTAVALSGDVDSINAALVVIGATLAHAAANGLNEVEDFRSGLDAMTTRTPFSGGSGALPTDPDSASAAMNIAIASLLTATVIGLYLSVTENLWLLAIGLLGVMIIVSYTRILNRNAWLCLIAPGLAFGPLMVVGSFLAVGDSFNWMVLSLSFPAFFFVNNLLLLNQLPDIEADRISGRCHFAIRLGTEKAVVMYVAQTALAYCSLIAAIYYLDAPASASLMLLTIPLALYVCVGAWHNRQQIPKMLPILGANVALTLSSLALLATGLFLAN